MRFFLPILLLVFMQGCSGSGPSPQPAAAVVSQPSPGGPALSLPLKSAERQQRIEAELNYYLHRHDPLDEGFDMVARYAEHGDSSMAVYLPPGPISLSSMLAPFQGKAILKDACGRLIIGRFQADTLASGVRIDSMGVYAGMMNRYGEAWGHGFYRAADGTYFEGHWAHDQREGFGLSIGPGHLKVGTWLRDQFRGEHFSHHSNRIYGIDISRYQHEKGRRRFSINWKKLRVSHLGRRIKQTQIRDEKADYPVSFVYIKSTEGVTIQNSYYDEDDAQARQHGIPVGAYHFFSTRTPAADQARHFLEHTRFRQGDLPPMLDIEPSDKQIEEMGGALVLFDAMRTWIGIVEQYTRCKPLLYVNQRFANTYLPLAPDLQADYHYWIARYGEYKPDIHLDIWQLSGDGHVQGIIPECDINVFNGYQGQWDDFLRTQTIP